MGDTIKQSNSENENTQEIVLIEIDNFQTNIKSLTNSSNYSKSMREMLGSLKSSRKPLKNTQDDFGQATVLGVPFQRSGGSRTSYTGKTMKDENIILMMNIIISDLSYTSIGGKSSKLKKLFTITLS